MIVKLFVMVIFLGLVCLAIKLCQTEYDKCYSEMEDIGIAVFGLCGGVTGGTSATDYLSEQCVSCPHLSLASINEEKGEENEKCI